MPKIITITLNTAIDKIVEISNFKVGEVFSIDNSHSFPAGKGVNVARAITHTKIHTIALGIVGRRNYELFQSLSSDSLLVDLTPMDGDTRTNITIYDSINNSETHIREKGCPIGSKEIEQVIDKLHRYVESGDIVVFSGSLPNNAPIDTYFKLGTLCKELGAQVILDSSGEVMKWGLRCKPDLIKPNLQELAEIAGKTLDSEKEIVLTAKEIADKYEIPIVVVSMGKEGVLVYEHGKQHAWRANIRLPKTDIRLHSVGSGDALVGGICSSILHRKEIVEMIREGVACGVANLFTIGPGIISQQTVDELRQKVLIYQIDIE